MFNRLIAWLLHLANSSPPAFSQEFYGLKKRLLYKHGTYDGDDIQHIAHKCWGYDRDGYGDIPCGPKCRKCGGTGVHHQVWYVLRRYTWYGYKFHVPNHRLYIAPESPVTITGRITHREYGHTATSEACLWLYMLCCEWKLLWKQLRGCRVCCWTIMPLLNLQKICMELGLRLSWHRCFYCRRTFFHGKSGWQICRSCRRKQERVSVTDDVPF